MSGRRLLAILAVIAAGTGVAVVGVFLVSLPVLLLGETVTAVAVLTPLVRTR